jgi:hypothetical protein
LSISGGHIDGQPAHISFAEGTPLREAAEKYLAACNLAKQHAGTIDYLERATPEEQGGAALLIAIQGLCKSSAAQNCPSLAALGFLVGAAYGAAIPADRLEIIPLALLAVGEGFGEAMKARSKGVRTEGRA